MPNLSHYSQVDNLEWIVLDPLDHSIFSIDLTSVMEALGCCLDLDDQKRISNVRTRLCALRSMDDGFVNYEINT